MKNQNETLAIIALVVISGMAMVIMGIEAKDIVLPIGGGIVGYLASGD